MGKFSDKQVETVGNFNHEDPPSQNIYREKIYEKDALANINQLPPILSSIQRGRSCDLRKSGLQRVRTCDLRKNGEYFGSTQDA